MDPIFVRKFTEAGLDGSNLHFEFMDLNKHPDPAHRRDFTRYLERKYEKRPIDVILAMHRTALTYLVEEGRPLFPGVPVINVIADPDFLTPGEFRSGYELVLSRMKRPFLIMPFSMGTDPTVKSILDLRPETHALVVISGSDSLDKKMAESTRRSLQPWQNTLKIEYVSGMHLEKVLERVAALPPNTAILYTVFGADPKRAYRNPDVLQRISGAANAPVFGLYDTLMGKGIVGGVMTDHANEADRAVRIALGILRGKLPAETITIDPAPLVPTFDWAQLDRWGMSENRLPPGSIVLNRPKTLWSDYREYVVGAVILFLAQSLLIGALILQTMRRRKAEAKYRDIFDGALEGIFETSPEGRLLTANAELARMLGYDSADEVTSTIHDLATQVWVNHDERAQYIRLLEKQGVVLNYECQLRRKDGKAIWVSMNTKRVCSQHGRTIYYSGFLEDITERKRTGKALAESQAQIVTLVDSTSDMIWSVDSERFGLLTFNRGLSEYFLKERGLHIEVGMDPGVLLPNEEYAEMWRTFYRRALEEGSFTTEYPVYTGTRTLLLKFNRLERDEVVFGVSVFGQDITERKKAEEALRESEEKYRSLYDSMMDGYVLVGMDGRILKYNEAFREMTGHSEAELTQLTFHDITTEKWRDAEKEIIERQVLIRGYSEVYEKEYRKRDGTLIPIELRTFLLKDETGSNIGLWAIIRDITGRKQIESEARKLREDLAHVTRVSTLGELTSSLAHEINQPLAAILSNAQAAQRFLSQDSPDMKEIGEILGDIIRDDNRAAEVIRKIRSLLKKEETRYEPLSLNDVIEDILNVIRNDSALAAVTIEKDFDPSLPAIWGDRIQMQQVILNLVFNAAEAMREAGHDHRRLTVRTSKKDGRFAEVSIRDIGPGIGENNSSRLFEPFYTTKSGGMGMGLAISKNIVKSHNGEIRAENNPDRGATFSFTVPFDSEVRS